MTFTVRGLIVLSAASGHHVRRQDEMVANSRVHFRGEKHNRLSSLDSLLRHRLAEGKKGVKVENRPFLSKLIFFNVSEHDYGNYTCVASNRLGHTNASITLFGKPSPELGREEEAGIEALREIRRESGVVRTG